MGKTFFEVDKNIYAMIADVMKEYHRPLHDKGVTINAVMCMNEDKWGAKVGLKRNGYPVAAQIKISSLEERGRGASDAKLTIDDYAWERLGEPQRRALIDHELQHLDLNPTKATKKKPSRDTDDLGRPRLKMRTHDWEVTGFKDVVVRHGECAVESLAIRKVEEMWVQLGLFPISGTRAA